MKKFNLEIFVLFFIYYKTVYVNSGKLLKPKNIPMLNK